MRRLPILTLAVAALLCACGARYGERRPDAFDPVRKDFAAADVDGDENLTREEVAAGMPRLLPVFETIDTDGNQRLSTGELRSWLEWQRVLRAPPPGSRLVH